jgi:hypothetical protein
VLEGGARDLNREHERHADSEPLAHLCSTHSRCIARRRDECSECGGRGCTVSDMLGGVHVVACNGRGHPWRGMEQTEKRGPSRVRVGGMLGLGLGLGLG